MICRTNVSGSTKPTPAPTDDPQWPVERPVYQIDLEQQAAFLMQAAGLALAADVERIAVYKLYDQNLPDGGESFGILSPADQSPRPAYRTWQTVTRHLSRVTQANRAQHDLVDAVRLQHDNGHETIMLWARTATPVTVQVSASTEKAQFLDQYGNMTLLRPVNDYYSLALAAATCNPIDGCAVGGPVSLLVQPPSDTHINVLTADGQTRLVFE